MSAPAQLDTPREAAAWLHARVRGALSTDSRAVGVGDGFIAWPGAATDGRRFVGDERAEQFGERNADPDELLVRVKPTRYVGAWGVSD